MSEENKSKITKNYSDIVNQLKHDTIVDALIGEFVITTDDLERINAKVTQADKNRELINILLKGPANGYLIFIRELRNDSAYESLADQIENTAVTRNVPLTLETWIGEHRLTPEKKNTVLKDLGLLYFSKAINPSDLRQIGPFLEISNADVQNLEYQHPRSPESICSELLMKWKNKNGNSATVGNLLKQLFEAWKMNQGSIHQHKVVEALDNIKK